LAFFLLLTREIVMSPHFPTYETKSLILRDYLAADRTVLANERTLLAYVRTALTFLIVSVTFIKFFDSPVIESLGWLFLITAVGLFMLGLSRYRRMNNSIAKLYAAVREQPEPRQEPVSGDPGDV
jgi:putative membrane protein